VRSLFTFSMGQAAGAYGRWMERHDPTALPALQDATAWLQPRGGGLFSSFNQGWLADVLVAQGQTVRARQHVALALLRGRQRDWIGGAMAYRAAARLAPWPIAPRYLVQARRVAAVRGSAHEAAVTDLCEAELGLAQGLAVEPLLDRAEAAFEAMGMGWHLARARRLR